MAEKQLFRRDFLKLGVATVAGLIIPKINFPPGEEETEESPIFVPTEVRKWGLIGPEQLITQEEVNREIKPNCVRLIDYDKAGQSEYCLVHKVILLPLLELLKDSRENGLRLLVNCGFRDIDWQTSHYNDSIKNGIPSGYLAPPGRSPHNIAMAVDYQTGGVRPEHGNGFELTPEGKWLDANAYKYGFVRSFLGGVHPTMPIREESWHYMYVGKDIAREHQWRRTHGEPKLEYYAFMKEMLEMKNKW